MVAPRTDIETAGVRQLEELLTKARREGYYGEVSLTVKFTNGVPRFMELLERKTQHIDNAPVTTSRV